MNLTSRSLISTPTTDEKATVAAILSHAAGELTFNDLTAFRPDHYTSSWRAVVLWMMNRKRGVRQCDLAQWFAMNTESVNRRIRDLDRLIESKGPEFAATREIIAKIIAEVKEADA